MSNNLDFRIEYRNTHLYQLRNEIQQKATAEEIEKRRLFQLIADHQYQTGLALPLKKKEIVFHTLEVGGLGDVSQVFRVADLISKSLPEFPVSVYILSQNKRKS